jgi:hypothetical protein
MILLGLILLVVGVLVMELAPEAVLKTLGRVSAIIGAVLLIVGVILLVAHGGGLHA